MSWDQVIEWESVEKESKKNSQAVREECDFYRHW